MFLQNNVQFRLEIFGLQDDTFRFKIREAFPLSQRFEVPEVLVGDPEQVPITIEDKTDSGFTAVLGNHHAVVTSKPFQIDIFSNGILVVSANARGLLKFEHSRLKATEDTQVLEHLSLSQSSTFVSIFFIFYTNKKVKVFQNGVFTFFCPLFKNKIVLKMKIILKNLKIPE